MRPSFLRKPARPGAVLAAGAATVSELVGACNVVRVGELALAHKLQRLGLRHEQARVGQASISFWEGGAGERGQQPVVLLHGFGASAMWQWHAQVGPLIAAGRRVIVPDLLWFGESWSRRREFGIDHQIEAVVGLLDYLGVERADLVGISYGGIVAHELTAAHPGRVAKLGILDSPGRVYTHADHRGLLERFAVRDVGELFVPSTPQGVGTLLALGYHRPPPTPRWIQGQVLTGMYSQFRAEKCALLEHLLAEIDSLDRRPGAVDHETLLIWGREDKVFPLEIGQRLAAKMGRRARLRVVERAGHAPNLEHGALVGRWLAEFVA
ncbi:alpha/beta hydrolase [Pseudenhygromyxa sp. WMMC2535]|uniref:alpha/beta fold hydrolase n=1 Tax=Pseudenhygromyxa sp. WMMC2535 TaxID=2712867 RepID=UPI0020D116B2|nr:alpha/beta hydrolase [Pseudenhygromyxa sp. WMMC2535]